ncbi:MAG: cyclic nucleotide-binding domain-containing protein [Actinobacteria bacterium]|nr:cyclic nucleotide-binding domain-containing protein [Actinomycetota bacterium]
MAVDPARLRSITVFTDLTDDDLALVAGRMEERQVESGEHLAREGSSGYFFFVIFDGHAEVSRDGEAIAALGPGHFFGESATLEATRRNATVTATSPMVVGALFGADFAKLAADSPELHGRISQVMQERRIAET